MTIKKLPLLLLLFFSMALFGCASGVPLEELLKPPKLSDEQLLIYNALMKGKSGNLTLKYPKSGDYRSAFVTADFINTDNGVKAEGAIVFYEMGGVTAERTLWLNFLDKNSSGEWESVYDLSVKGSDIDRISFFSLGDDESVNILVDYTNNQAEKAFVLIKYKDRVPQKLIEGAYSYICVGEFLGRGSDELLIIRNDYTLETASISFYSWNEGRFVLTGNCELDPSAGEYTSITQGKLNNGVTALFINHRKYVSRDRYGTDIIYTQSSLKLANLTLQNTDNPERVLRRTNNYTELANPMDINGDGFVELCGSTGEFPGYSALSSPDKVRPVIWLSLVGGKLENSYYSYYSVKNDFVFLFPNRWKNAVTVKISTDGKQVSFYEAALSVNDVDNELLSILTSSDAAGAGWKLYSTNPESGFNYYIKTPNPDGPLSLTSDELTLSFKILSRIDRQNEIIFTALGGDSA